MEGNFVIEKKPELGELINKSSFKRLTERIR